MPEFCDCLKIIKIPEFLWYLPEKNFFPIFREGGTCPLAPASQRLWWQCCEDHQHSQWEELKFDPTDPPWTPYEIVTKYDLHDYVMDIFHQEKSGLNPHLREIYTLMFGCLLVILSWFLAKCDGTRRPYIFTKLTMNATLHAVAFSISADQHRLYILDSALY